MVTSRPSAIEEGECGDAELKTRPSSVFDYWFATKTFWDKNASGWNGNYIERLLQIKRRV